jgi:hypothetical protein
MYIRGLLVMLREVAPVSSHSVLHRPPLVHARA